MSALEEEERRSRERGKNWHFRSPKGGRGWMYSSPSFTHLYYLFSSLSHTERRSTSSSIANPHQHPSPFISITFPLILPRVQEALLTSQPTWQQPINYDWQVFGPIKAPPYFMHSKSDCRLLRRVGADMFIVIMVAGGGGDGCSPTLGVSKAPSVYGGQTDGNSGKRESPPHP